MKKLKHLIELPEAETNLTLWKADLTQDGSFDEAIEGCHGVFHVATPMDFESKDPEVHIYDLLYLFCILSYIFLFIEMTISYMYHRMKS